MSFRTENIQYSNSSSNNLNNSNSNSTVGERLSVSEVFSSLTDVVPQDDYLPFYVSQYRKLGYKRFMELANKARAGGRNPARLFFWMLRNNKIVV